MKKISGITSVESKADFQRELLEKFVQQNLPYSSKKQNKITGMGRFASHYKEFESCAAETPINGTVEIFLKTNDPFSIGKLSVPVSSRFFVFCTRNNTENYKVSCTCSLS